MSIGKRNDDNLGTYFDGFVDDLGVWDRALSPAEIAALFSSTPLSQGCTDADACNYNEDANIDDGSCYPCEIPASHCGSGTIWDETSQTCIPDNPSDLNYDGCVDVNDFMGHLAAFGSGCEEGVAETPWQCGDPLEYQGYDYETVQIGEQCWFAENLRAENYRNGDAIPYGLDADAWATTMEGARAIFDNDPSWLGSYGQLYNLYAVMDVRGICQRVGMSLTQLSSTLSLKL